MLYFQPVFNQTVSVRSKTKTKSGRLLPILSQSKDNLNVPKLECDNSMLEEIPYYKFLLEWIQKMWEMFMYISILFVIHIDNYNTTCVFNY